MTTVGFLHTSPAHVPTFRALVEELLPGVDVVDVVDELLLDQAQRLGVRDVRVIGGVADRVAELIGADVVVCTCSTVGGLAEEVGRAAGAKVVRVDRAMVERAVELASGGGGRVAVLAAVESTLVPTGDLFDEVMLTTGADIAVELVPVVGAWTQFTAGDLADYHRTVAAAISGVEASVDVIVLAQASMAPAVALVDVRPPVLSSPRLAIEALRAFAA